MLAVKFGKANEFLQLVCLRNYQCIFKTVDSCERNIHRDNHRWTETPEKREESLHNFVIILYEFKHKKSKFCCSNLASNTLQRLTLCRVLASTFLPPREELNSSENSLKTSTCKIPMNFQACFVVFHF